MNYLLIKRTNSEHNMYWNADRYTWGPLDEATKFLTNTRIDPINLPGTTTDWMFVPPTSDQDRVDKINKALQALQAAIQEAREAGLLVHIGLPEFPKIIRVTRKFSPQGDQQ